MNPERVEHNVRHLRQFVGVDLLEDGIQQGNVFHDQLIIANIDAIKDVIRVFDEKEDTGAENFLRTYSEDKR